MRTNRTVVALSASLLLGACNDRPEQPAALSDDLKRDLAVASPAGGDLAIAPQSSRRMRFVSDVELAKASVPEKRPKVSHRHVKPAVRPEPAPETTTDEAMDEVVAMAAESPAPVSVTEVPVPEPTVVVAQVPSPEPASVPSESPNEGRVGDRGQGSGWGGLLGGIIGAVVIRGGHGGVDKCDPRTDGRARPPVLIGRPDFGLPLPTGEPSFPRSRRRFP